MAVVTQGERPGFDSLGFVDDIRHQQRDTEQTTDAAPAFRYLP